MPQQSTARHSYGTTLWNAPWLVGDPDTFTQVGKVTEESIAYGGLKNVSLGGRSFSDVAVTHMESPDQVKEYIPGLEEGGEIELEFHYSAALLNQINSYLPSVTRTFPDNGSKRWRIQDYEGNYISITGFLHPPNVEYQEDQPVAIKTKVKNAKGRPTLTTV